jgi:hypothetical protein
LCVFSFFDFLVVAVCEFLCFDGLGWDRTLRIWNSSTRLEIARLAHSAGVIGVVWLEGAAGVMVLGEDGVLGKWTRSVSSASASCRSLRLIPPSGRPKSMAVGAHYARWDRAGCGLGVCPRPDCGCVPRVGR